MCWTATGNRRSLGQILGIKTAHLTEWHYSVAVAYVGRWIHRRAQWWEIQSPSTPESRCRLIRQGSSSMYLCFIMSHACSIVVLTYSLSWTDPIITQHWNGVGRWSIMLKRIFIESPYRWLIGSHTDNTQHIQNMYYVELSTGNPSVIGD